MRQAAVAGTTRQPYYVLTSNQSIETFGRPKGNYLEVGSRGDESLRLTINRKKPQSSSVTFKTSTKC